MADSAPRTPRPSHQLGDDNDTDARLSPTQPLSSSAYPRPPHQLGDDDNDTDARLSSTQPVSSSRFDRYRDDDISTASDTDSDVAGCKIDLTGRAGDVFWQAEGLTQHASDLRMDLHLDTIATPRTAFFLLRGQCALKNGTPVSVPLYLFIHPENIQSVEVASAPLPTPTTEPVATSANRFVRLRFIMTQPPTLVAPLNRPLEAKPRSKAVLDTLYSLAAAKDFSIYLNRLLLPMEILPQLALLPSTFSPANIHSRPRTDEDRASIVRLYAGAGGQIITTGAAACETTHQEADEARPASSTHATSGVLRDAAQISTPTQTRKRSARASGLLPPYLDREDERVIAGPSNHRLFESTEQNASQSQESTQLFSPSDRKGKRPRLATPSDLASPPSLPPLPSAFDFLEASTDPSKFSSIKQQFLIRDAALEKLAKQLLARNAALEARVEHFSKLEDWVRLEVGEQVGGEVARQLDKLHRKTGRKWEEEIRDEVREKITEDVKEELYEGATQEVLKRMAVVLVEAVDRSGWLVPGSTACGNLLSRSIVPGENALYAAVADVQKRYGAEMSVEEMARVMDRFKNDTMSAVMYNACGEKMKDHYVGQWKADTRVEWRGSRGQLRRGDNFKD